jgi:hypothetical protein
MLQRANKAMKLYSFIFLTVSSTSEFEQQRTPVSMALEELQKFARIFFWTLYRILSAHCVENIENPQLRIAQCES